jgi:hypothetical protein
MKTFESLNVFERENAIEQAFYSIMDSITCGVIEVTLVEQENQEALDRVLKKGNQRFATLSILHNKGIRKELTRLALVAASESMYNDDGTLLKDGKNVETFLN